jgi:hypothetical protein
MLSDRDLIYRYSITYTARTEKALRRNILFNVESHDIVAITNRAIDPQGEVSKTNGRTRSVRITCAKNEAGVRLGILEGKS